MMARFVGGQYDGQTLDVERVWDFAAGATESCAEARARGGFCRRPELYDKPVVNGYVGPMWNGDSLLYETYEVHRAMGI